MDSSFFVYDAWSDMAKRVPPGRAGNTTLPSFVSHADLNWARPTGNVRWPLSNCLISSCADVRIRICFQAYSTVEDLAKLASVFLVGQEERTNVLGIYSSTLREMLTPSFINDDQVRSLQLSVL